MATEVAQILYFTEFDAGISQQQVIDFEYSDQHQFTFRKTWTYKGNIDSGIFVAKGENILNGTSSCVPSSYYNEWKKSAIEYINDLKRSVNAYSDEVDEVDPENSQPADREMYNEPPINSYDWRKNPTEEARQLELTKRLNNMSDEDKSMLMKIIHFDFIMEIMDAMKNLKDTSEEVWKNIISKGQRLLNINIKDENGINFNDFLGKLLPILAGLAALMIGLQQAKKAEIEASDVPNEDYENDPLTSSQNSTDIDPITNEMGSIIMSMCSQQLNGFSLK